jgi:hypothetical protein
MLCLLDIGVSHNFITLKSAKRMELPLEELKTPIKVHFADGGCLSHDVASKRRAFSTRELERKGGFVGFHLKGDGLHFGNGIHHL